MKRFFLLETRHDGDSIYVATVAEGVEFRDGRIGIEWLNTRDLKSVGYYNNLDAIRTPTIEVRYCD